MTFGIFVVWVLMGMLAGVLAGMLVHEGGYSLKRDVTLGLLGSIGVSWLARGTGLITSSSLFGAALVALIGAALVLGAQRKYRPSRTGSEGAVEIWWRRGLGAVVVVVLGWMLLAPANPTVATAAATDDKTYEVTPASMPLKAGLVTGELLDMKVTERVEQGSGRIVAPATLTARITLKNSSSNQTVRLVGGTLRYIDAKGQPMVLEDNRADPALKFSSAERLDPGQETSESVEVAFPTAALKHGTMKSIRLELAYVPSPVHHETVNVPVAVGVKP